MFDHYYCINSKKTHQKLRKCLRTLFFSLTTIFLHAHSFYKYKRLSLSQSPGDQTKSFEISVVWDSQSVTSFTICMFVALQLARKQSRTVELRNVADSILFIHSKKICDQCLFDPVLHAISSIICDTHLSVDSFSSMSVTFVVYIKECRSGEFSH